jgi:hypothetical protein
MNAVPGVFVEENSRYLAHFSRGRVQVQVSTGNISVVFSMPLCEENKV